MDRPETVREEVEEYRQLVNDPSIDRPALLVLGRHGESLRNVAKAGNVYFCDEEARRIVKGIPDHDIPLTDIGWAQARPTGVGLRREFGVFDYHYHSGYLRAEQTNEGILEAYTEEERASIKVRRNAFIRERDPGYTYEMTDAEADLYFPYLKPYWAEFGGFFATPPGGESLARVVERVYLFLSMLFRDRKGQKIFVSTHGGTTRCFRFLLERWDYKQATKWPSGQAPVNCGLTIYRYSQEQQRLVLADYNRVFYDRDRLLTREPERDIIRD